METVPFYDVESGTLVTIPAEELAPGAIRARVHGIDGIVWLLPDKIVSSPISHPLFPESERQRIRRIQETFAEHRPLSCDEWEDEFRRDADPAPEIAIWSHAADVYADSIAGHQWSEAERDEVYGVILTCMMASSETIWRVLSLSVLDRKQAEEIIGRVYGRRKRA